MPTTYAIPNGRTVMDATLWTSTGTTQSISNADLGTVGFKPDLVWTKTRAVTSDHYLNDSVSGASKTVSSNTSAVAATYPNFVTSFDSSGFSLGTGNYGVGNTIVAWQWQAGQGTNTTNTDGYVTSTVSVNQTAGFSIINWTGNGSATTIGHGLGVAPQFMLCKSRSIANDWLVYHQSMGNGSYMYLNLQSGQQSATAAWNNTSPTSTVFTVGTNSVINTNGSINVTYAWAPVAGFSQFGSYTGNGSTDGPFVYTGFRPRYIMFKNTGTIGGYGDWYVLDTVRNTYNLASTMLYPDTGTQEYTNNTAYAIDVLSNGFKIRTTYNDFNASGYIYIYAAFAENPFKYANAR